MPVAKGRRQIVIVDRPAALAGRTADWRETSFVGQTAALSYRVDRRQTLPWDYFQLARHSDKITRNSHKDLASMRSGSERSFGAYLPTGIIRTEGRPGDRRAWRGARAGKQQSNRPRSLLLRQRESEGGWRLAGRGSGWRLGVFPRTQEVLR
jgi:hypothetical protein